MPEAQARDHKNIENDHHKGQTLKDPKGIGAGRQV